VPQVRPHHFSHTTESAGELMFRRSMLLPFSAVAAGRQFLVQVPGASQSILLCQTPSLPTCSTG
jgi:hypothetical protein